MEFNFASPDVDAMIGQSKAQLMWASVKQLDWRMALFSILICALIQHTSITCLVSKSTEQVSHFLQEFWSVTT